jgi:signal transduction histidine kinase
MVVDSIAAVARTSGRGRLIGLIPGGGATLLAAGGVVEVLRWIHVLAWRLAPIRQRQSPRLVLGLVAGVTLTIGASAAASGLANDLTVLLTTAAAQVVLLAALWFALSWALPRLFGRLAVAAAELNASLWERRAQRRRLNTPPP